jgi:cytochrome P450 family 93 subfamily A
MEILGATLGLMNSSTLFPLLIIVIFIATIIRILYNANPAPTVPSPLALPIIGHLHLLGPLPHQSFHHLSLRFGPIFRLRLGCISCLVASSPQVVKSFLKTHEPSFSDRPISSAAQNLVYDGSDFSFAPYGPYWRFIKKLCTSQHFGGQTLDLLYHIRRDEIQRLVRALFDNSKRVQEVDLEIEFVRLASNIVSRMLIGRQWVGKDDELTELKTVVGEIEEILGLFDIKDYIWVLQKLGFDLQGISHRVKDVKGRFDRMVEGVLKEKEAARQRKRGEKDGTEGVMEENRDILDMLMDVYDDDGAEIRLTRDNIKAFILVNFLNYFC